MVRCEGEEATSCSELGRRRGKRVSPACFYLQTNAHSSFALAVVFSALELIGGLREQGWRMVQASHPRCILHPHVVLPLSQTE